MKIAPDIVEALGPELLREGLRLREGNVAETLIRIRRPPASVASRDTPLIDVRNVRVGRNGLQVRVYVPIRASPAGIVVNIHGGGWVAGSIENDHARCAAISELSGCVVASVGYRLAPEAPFPAGVEDCAEAITWALSSTESFAVPAGNVAVLGSSAGANLAVAAMLRLAEDHAQDLPKRQILLYPMCDASFAFPSYRENAEGFFLSSRDVAWYWDLYANESDRRSPFASILQAKDFSRLPSGLMITSERDPLRDEGEALASKMRDDSVRLNCIRYLGAIHGFVSLTPKSALTRLALNQVVNEIRETFSI